MWLVASACGSTEDSCQQAAAKLRSCDVGGASNPAECKSERDRCVARCVLDAPCEDIVAATEQNSYVDCLAECVASTTDS